VPRVKTSGATSHHGVNRDNFNFESSKAQRCSIVNGVGRPVFTHGPPGPGPGRQIFRGGILKKSRLKYSMWKKKAVHEREI